MFFGFVVEVTFLNFFCRRNLCYFHTFLYSVKKKIIIFNNNWGIHTLIVYICFVLIDLINGYKKNHKIFMRIVCIMVFHTNC